jgi:hypothetical protein
MILQGLAGTVVGTIATLAVGFAKHAIGQKKSMKSRQAEKLRRAAMRLTFLDGAEQTIAGGVGEFFLYAMIPIMENGGGEPNLDGSPADKLAMPVLAGFIAGGLLALIFGLLDNLLKHQRIDSK